jgi:hypothetical protein
MREDEEILYVKIIDIKAYSFGSTISATSGFFLLEIFSKGVRL